MDAHVSKPVRPEALYQALADCLTAPARPAAAKSA
jgi:hypothetical protein